MTGAVKNSPEPGIEFVDGGENIGESEAVIAFIHRRSGFRGGRFGTITICPGDVAGAAGNSGKTGGVYNGYLVGEFRGGFVELVRYAARRKPALRRSAGGHVNLEGGSLAGLVKLCWSKVRVTIS